MQTHQIKKNSTNKKSRQIGRGGKRGKTSGRGMKGQTARAGHKVRPAIRDIIKKIPKLRGYRFKSIQTKPIIVTLTQIDKNFESNEKVTPMTLAEKRIISLVKGKMPKVKILANGQITKKITITGCLMSLSVKNKIEKIGGQIEK